MQPSREEVLQELERVLESPEFVKSDRLRRFLRHTTLNTLDNRPDRLKETVIGVEAFDRQVGYDPKTDAIVRVEARRLRQKLDQYYLNEGKNSRIRIDLPKGAYLVEATIRHQDPPKPQPAVRTVERMAWIGGLVLFAAVAVVAYVASDRDGSPLVQPRRLSSGSGWATDPVLSPDGQNVIYATDRASENHLSLWIRGLDGSEPRRLTASPADAFDPDVSPDGKWMVYRSRRPEAPGVYRQPMDDERSARLLAPGGSWPRISPDGRWVLYTIRNEQEWSAGTIFVVPAEGGMPRQLATGFADAHYAIWSEDGKHVLFCGTEESNVPEREHDWWVVPLATGEPAVKTDAFPHLVNFLKAGSRVPPNQHVEQPGSWLGGSVFFSSPQGSTQSLWRMALDQKFRVSDSQQPARLTQGPTMDLRPRARRVKDQIRVVFSSGTYNIDLWSVPINARTGEVTGQPTRVTSQPSMETFPTLSPAADLLAYVGDGTGERQIYLRDLKTNQDRRVLPNKVSQDHPVISPDGAWVAFRELRRPEVPIMLARTRSEHVHEVHPDAGAPQSWSPDGRFLLYEPGATIAFIGRLDVPAKTNEVFLTHPEFSLRGATYSPDGKWIAFHAELSREYRRIFIARGDRPTPPVEWIPVTSGSGFEVNPRWSPDGGLLYFVNELGGKRGIWAQRVNMLSKRPDGKPFEVFDPNSARRSLLRLTRSRVGAIGPVLGGGRLFFAMDEQIGDIYYAEVP